MAVFVSVVAVAIALGCLIAIMATDIKEQAGAQKENTRKDGE